MAKHNDPDYAMLQVRLPRKLVQRLDHFCVDNDRTRQSAVEQLLREGLDALNYHYPPLEGQA